MALNFPAKIYQILENESTDIIRWHANGNAFRIVDHDRFEREIIPKYFRHNQLSSVQRQLNLYGFKCVSRGEDKGAFFHTKFRKGDWEVVKTITRFVTGKKSADELNAVVVEKQSVSTKSSGSPVQQNATFSSSFPSMPMVAQPKPSNPNPASASNSLASSFRSPFDMFAVYEPPTPMFHQMMPSSEPHLAWQSWNQLSNGMYPMSASTMYAPGLALPKNDSSDDHGDFDFGGNFALSHNQALGATVDMMASTHNHGNVTMNESESSGLSAQSAAESLEVKAYPRTDKQAAIDNLKKSKADEVIPKANKPFVYVVNEAVTIDPDFDLGDDFDLFCDTDLMPPALQLSPRQTFAGHANTDGHSFVCSVCQKRQTKF